MKVAGYAVVRGKDYVTIINHLEDGTQVEMQYELVDAGPLAAVLICAGGTVEASPLPMRRPDYLRVVPDSEEG